MVCVDFNVRIGFPDPGSSIVMFGTVAVSAVLDVIPIVGAVKSIFDCATISN